MATIYKFSGYAVAPDGDLYTRLTEFLRRCPDAIVHHIKVVAKDVGEWDDSNPFNRLSCPVEECEKYFVRKAE